jgi:ribosomal protein S15P/S13E
MITFIKKTIKKIVDYYKRKRIEKLYKKRIEELKKRDPFIYKH